MALVGVTAVAVVTSGWLLLGRAPSAPAATDAPSDAPAPAEAIVTDPTTPVTEVAAPALLDPELGARLSYQRRHALLAGVDPTLVDPTLHAGLDLLQAGQTSTPCTVFADALGVLEASVGDHGWAVEPARAPLRPGPDESATACDGLGARLAALRPAPEPEDDAEPAVVTPEKRAKKKRRDSKLSDPFDGTAKHKEPVATKKKKKKKRPSIATKLDEDLREMGK